MAFNTIPQHQVTIWQSLTPYATIDHDVEPQSRPKKRQRTHYQQDAQTIEPGYTNFNLNPHGTQIPTIFPWKRTEWPMKSQKPPYDGSFSEYSFVRSSISSEWIQCGVPTDLGSSQDLLSNACSTRASVEPSMPFSCAHITSVAPPGHIPEIPDMQFQDSNSIAGCSGGVDMPVAPYVHLDVPVESWLPHMFSPSHVDVIQADCEPLRPDTSYWLAEPAIDDCVRDPPDEQASLTFADFFGETGVDSGNEPLHEADFGTHTGDDMGLQFNMTYDEEPGYTIIHRRLNSEISPNTRMKVSDIYPQSSSPVVSNFEFRNTTVSDLRSNAAVKAKARRIPAKRRGPLSDEGKREASEMRKLIACLYCSLSKIKCEATATCGSCDLKNQLCLRFRLEQDTPLLFPETIAGHLSQAAAKHLSGELAGEFVGQAIEVQVTCGSGFSPIKVKVMEFKPKMEKHYVVPIISSNPKTDRARELTRTAMPVALQPKDMDCLMKTWSKNVSEMIEDEGDILKVLPRKINRIARGLIVAISRYHCLVRVPGATNLVGKALKLYAIYISMDRVFKFSRSSELMVYEKLGGSTFPKRHTTAITRLFNRQIKTAINQYLHHETAAILKKLDSILRKENSKKFWSSAFCVSCLLCICIEEIQIAIDLAFWQDSQGTENSSSSESVNACRDLEKHLYEHITRLFHGAYRTDQRSSSTNSGYNPIQDAPGSQLGDNCVALMRDIWRIMSKDEDYISQCAGTSIMGGQSTSLDDHLMFREKNSGRLLCKFLESFRVSGGRR